MQKNSDYTKQPKGKDNEQWRLIKRAWIGSIKEEEIGYLRPTIALILDQQAQQKISCNCPHEKTCKKIVKKLEWKPE